MNDTCKNCGICCKLIPIYGTTMIRDGVEPSPDFIYPVDINGLQGINAEYVKNVQNICPEVQFYRCKYISDDNICTHPDKPESCKNFPKSATALIPEDCEFYGEIFIKHEKLKQKIRKLKEEIIHYEALIASKEKDSKAYQRIITSHKNYIEKFRIFGSNNW